MWQFVEQSCLLTEFAHNLSSLQQDTSHSLHTIPLWPLFSWTPPLHHHHLSFFIYVSSGELCVYVVCFPWFSLSWWFCWFVISFCNPDVPSGRMPLSSRVQYSYGTVVLLRVRPHNYCRTPYAVRPILQYPGKTICSHVLLLLVPQ